MRKKSLLEFLRILGSGIMACETIDESYGPCEKTDLILDLVEALKSNSCSMSVAGAAFAINQCILGFDILNLERPHLSIATCDLDVQEPIYRRKAEVAILAQTEQQLDEEEKLINPEKYDDSGEVLTSRLLSFMTANKEVLLKEQRDEIETELDELFKDPFFVSELVEVCAILLSEKSRRDAHLQLAMLMKSLCDRCIIGVQAVVLVQNYLGPKRDKLTKRGLITYVSPYLDFEL